MENNATYRKNTSLTEISLIKYSFEEKIKLK